MERSKRGQVLAAATVMLVPALLALVLTRSEAANKTPVVTEVLRELAHGSRSDRSLPHLDSPVAAAAQGGRDLAIEFERGIRVPLGTMEIPAIGLRTKFYDGVVDEAVELGPGHWPGTPWPGQPGNSVFAGHRTTYTHPFRDLDLLDAGARVRIQMRNGDPVTYRVSKTTIVPEAEYARFVLKQPANKKARLLTLFACTPKGSRSHRIVVQAKAAPQRNQLRGDGEARR